MGGGQEIAYSGEIHSSVALDYRRMLHGIACSHLVEILSGQIIQLGIAIYRNSKDE